MLKINDIYRLCDTNRWHIVKVRREQSVAEHSFIVTLLADAIGEAVKGPEVYDSFDRTQVLMHALTHDVAECVTGDIPSPIKNFLGVRKVLEEMESEIMGKYYGRGNKVSEFAKQVVKIADIAESVKYLTLNCDSRHGELVLAKNHEALARAIRSSFDSVGQQDAAAKVVTQFLTGTCYTLDCFIEEKENEY